MSQYVSYDEFLNVVKQNQLLAKRLVEKNNYIAKLEGRIKEMQRVSTYHDDVLRLEHLMMNEPRDEQHSYSYVGHCGTHDCGKSQKMEYNIPFENSVKQRHEEIIPL
jgi:hypothetical protein